MGIGGGRRGVRGASYVCIVLYIGLTFGFKPQANSSPVQLFVYVYIYVYRLAFFFGVQERTFSLPFIITRLEHLCYQYQYRSASFTRFPPLIVHTRRSGVCKKTRQTSTKLSLQGNFFFFLCGREGGDGGYGWRDGGMEGCGIWAAGVPDFYLSIINQH